MMILLLQYWYCASMLKWLFLDRFTHCWFHSHDSKKWSRDNKHLFARMATVSRTAVASSFKVPCLRQMLTMHTINFASVELFCVIYLWFKFDQKRGPAWKPAKVDVASSLNNICNLFIYFIYLYLARKCETQQPCKQAVKQLPTAHDHKIMKFVIALSPLLIMWMTSMVCVTACQNKNKQQFLHSNCLRTCQVIPNQWSVQFHQSKK